MRRLLGGFPLVATRFRFGILRDDMCGSLLALFADPITNTNFASSSFAMVWRACLRVRSSTLFVSGVGLDCLAYLFKFDSTALKRLSIRISRASIRAV
jgi:hypothetical protein